MNYFINYFSVQTEETKNMYRRNKSLKNLIEIALIAALYAVLTFFSATIGVAYSGVQLRLSEVLTILPALTPNAIPGLTIGCFISNLASPFGVLDIIIGTLSTFITSVLTRMLRKITLKGIPILSPLPPVILGAASVGLMISFFNLGKFSFSLFFTVFFYVSLSQFIMCYVLGIPFFIILNKQKKEW